MLLASNLLLLSIASLGAASPILQERAPAQVITRCTTPNTVALTFDDGPYIYLNQVVDILEQNNATGTFFFNGLNWACIYDNAARVKYAYDNGHQVASHTWAHSHLNTLTWDQLHHQFWLVELALRKITGATPAFMRPPYGEYNGLVREVAGVRGQKIVIWDFDSGDSSGVSPSAQKQRYTNVANARPSTILTLNHETYQSSVVDVLPHALSVLKAKGYRFVSVAECMGMAPYQSVVAPSPRDSTWHC